MSIARIHSENLVNYGILPLIFEDPGDADTLTLGSVVTIDGIRDILSGSGKHMSAMVDGKAIGLRIDVSPRQRAVLLAGGAIPWMREKLHRGVVRLASGDQDIKVL